jgi:hypothetical protein
VEMGMSFEEGGGGGEFCVVLGWSERSVAFAVRVGLTTVDVEDTGQRRDILNTTMNLWGKR